mgnify:CR=1 FL=1
MINQIELRERFSKIFAEAYFCQYIRRENVVMNDPAVVFDYKSNTFSWGSSLTPNGNETVHVITLEEGFFEDLGDSSQEDLALFIESAADDLWREVMSKISDMI